MASLGRIGLLGERGLVARAAAVLADSGVEVTRSRLAKAAPPRGVDVLVSGLPEGDATAPTAIRLCEQAGGLPMVLIVDSIEAAAAAQMLRAGVRGIVLSAQLEQALVPTVRAAHAGQVAIPRAIRREVFPPMLSARESTVLALVTQGRTNAEIASSLHLEESTVKSHLGSLFAKLGVRSREDAAAAVLNSDSQIASGVLAVTDQHR
jgi:DNA-binding NarL/FixJ family response regulator